MKTAKTYALLMRAEAQALINAGLVAQTNISHCRTSATGRYLVSWHDERIRALRDRQERVGRRFSVMTPDEARAYFEREERAALGVPEL